MVRFCKFLGRLVGSFFRFISFVVLKNFKIYFFNWYFVMPSWPAPAYFNSLKLKFMFLTSRLLCCLVSRRLSLAAKVVGTQGRRMEERRLADNVFKMAEYSLNGGWLHNFWKEQMCKNTNASTVLQINKKHQIAMSAFLKCVTWTETSHPGWL